jgi:hypothetical protein
LILFLKKFEKIISLQMPAISGLLIIKGTFL